MIKERSHYLTLSNGNLIIRMTKSDNLTTKEGRLVRLYVFIWKLLLERD